MTEIKKRRNPTSLNPVKDFLVEKYRANRACPPHFVEGFMRTLREKFRGDNGIFPNDLKEFDIKACYPIARNFLNLSGNDLLPFNDLREKRNKWYGHLDRLEIEDANYAVLMYILKLKMHLTIRLS